MTTASKVQREWKRRPLEHRTEAIGAWADVLQTRTERLTRLAVEEVGKPLREVRVEMARMIESIRVALRCFTEEPSERYLGRIGNETSRARRCPLGVIAVITPWNNPAFLPASKIAAAVALGNGVVWKPATRVPEDEHRAPGEPPGGRHSFRSRESGLRRRRDGPSPHRAARGGRGDLDRIHSDRQASRRRMRRTDQASAGGAGGNNAVLVTESCDRASVAREIATHAFAYAGQGCTATRRLILPARIADEFMEELRKSTRLLPSGTRRMRRPSSVRSSRERTALRPESRGGGRGGRRSSL